MARLLVERGAWFDVFIAIGLRDPARVERCLRDDPEALDHRTGQGKYSVAHDGKRAATRDEIGDRRGDIYRWVFAHNISAIEAAVLLGYDDIVELLLRHASPAQRLLAACAKADRAAAEAVVASHPGVVASLGRHQMRLIADKAQANDAAAVALMLDLGFDARVTGPDDGDALHWAAFHGNRRDGAGAAAARSADRRPRREPRRHAARTGASTGPCTGGRRRGAISRPPPGCSSTRGNAAIRPTCQPAATIWTPSCVPPSRRPGSNRTEKPASRRGPLIGLSPPSRMEAIKGASMFAPLFTSWRLTVATLVAMLVATSALAQTPTGTILGSVKDAQGAVVPGATVTATNLGTQYSRSAVTDGAGEYALRLLPIGNYMVVVTMPGFKNFTQTGIVLEVGRNARVDATIELGAVSETVSVVGDSPLVDTASASLSRTVGQNEVLNLPLVNRDLYPLLSITGGVTSNESSNSLGGPEQLTTINGSGRAQMGTVNFQLDGGNNTAGLRGTGNPAPNPEAVQEFRVLTNGYSAEYGRYSAGVVDVVTKSGTNVFHGAAFEFFRNEKLNSRAGRRRARRRTNDPLDRNQYRRGVWRPDREGQDVLLRQLLGTAPGGDVLPEHGRGADGARARRRLLAVGSTGRSDPVTGQPFPGGIIPARPVRYRGEDDSGQIRPLVQPAQQLLRSPPSGPRAHQRGDAEARSPALGHAVPRGELLLPERNRHAADVGAPIDRRRQHPVGRPGFRVEAAQRQPGPHLDAGPDDDQSAARDLHAPVRRAREQSRRRRSAISTRSSRFKAIRRCRGSPSPASSPARPRSPDRTRAAITIGVKDALSITKGKHSFKMGGDFSYEKIIHDTLLDNYGVFTFNGSKTGNAYADFLLGLPATMTQDAPVRKTDNGAYISAFAQDDFRVHSRVTLNLGVRYDVQFPFTDPQDRKLAFVPGQKSTVNPTAPVGPAVPRRHRREPRDRADRHQ